MVIQEDNRVIIDRFINGAKLAERWFCNAVLIMSYVSNGELTPYGQLGISPDGERCFTRNVDIRKADYLTDLDPWHNRKVICFDLDEVERIEKENPRLTIPPPLPPSWAPPKKPWTAPTNTSPPATSPAVSAPSHDHTEAQDRIADLERQLEQATRERDETRREKEDLVAKLAGIEATLGTSRATIGKLKKHARTLVAGYESAAKLACEIGRRPRADGNPWSKDEVLALAAEIDVSIKGGCLKAFKAGMPAGLVKKDAGARPTASREESTDNEKD